MGAETHGENVDDPGPMVFVLFGATGDLARRMVLPAFYRLAREGLQAVGDTPEHFDGFVRAEIATVRKLVAATGIKGE